MWLEAAKSHWYNARGWRTGRRIVVFESDDWGAIRTPSLAVFERLQNSRNGIRVNRFDALDCLESGEDLQALAEVLSSFRSNHGGPARFTCNMVLQNPDYQAIEEADFETYSAESLFASYQRVHGQDLAPLWQEIQQEKFIQPQFHAREHLNVALWMKDLRAGHPATREAFGLGCYGQMQSTGSPHQGHYLAAYHANGRADLEEKGRVLAEGLELFERLFGFRSSTMIPCNYTWAGELTGQLAARGVLGLQGARVAHIPQVDAEGKLGRERRYLRSEPSGKLVDLVRNVTFEPYAKPDEDPVAPALRQVSTAFLWRKPAVVSTHRINYVSGLDLRHRDRSLSLLRELIAGILKRWPDVEFMTSDELARLMKSASESEPG